MTVGDDDAEAFARAAESATPKIRKRREDTRREVAAFFGLRVAHLPPPDSAGWMRLLGTYTFAKRPGYGVENLRHMLDQTIFNPPRAT